MREAIGHLQGFSLQLFASARKCKPAKRYADNIRKAPLPPGKEHPQYRSQNALPQISQRTGGLSPINKIPRSRELQIQHSVVHRNAQA
jgi:hypothetical protein